MEVQTILQTLKDKYVGSMVHIYKDYSGNLSLKETEESEKRISVIIVDIEKNIQGFFLVFNYLENRTYLRLYNI